VAKNSENVPMPGYTHMQKAMPSSVSDWLGAYADAFAELAPLVKATYAFIDQSPLGSAAGFGVKGLEQDMEFTAKEMGFASVQENPIYAGLSRGYFESAVLNACGLVMTLAGRFASDMLFFTTQELDYFSLPAEYTTGSSIMPNKRNYDIFEIMRGNAKVVDACAIQIKSITAGLGGGFQRDLQLSKEPFIKGVEITAGTLDLLIETVPKLQLHEQKLKAAMTGDLYATEKAYGLVKQGVPFREAYNRVKSELFKGDEK
jgi:argininosuccinate lyase